MIRGIREITSVGATRKAAIYAICASFTLPWMCVMPAAAQEHPGLDLHWEAPPGCPQEKAVRDRIRAIAPSVERDLHLRAEGTIAQVEGRFRLRLVVGDGRSSGERVIESTSCTELAGAAAVALRLLAQAVPHATEDAERDVRNNAQPTPAGSASSNPSNPPSTEPPPAVPAPTNTNPAEQPPVPEAPKAGTSEPTNEQTAARSWRVLLRAPFATSDIGTLASPAVGLGAGLGLRIDSWRFLLSGHISRDRTILAKDVSGYGVDVGWATAELSACRGIRAGRLELAPCVTVAMERMTARGFGDQIAPQTQSPIWLGVGAAVVGYWYPSNWLALFLSVGGRVQTSRPVVSLDVIGTVYQVAPAELTLAIGSEWIL
jgi:hypothetical protein